MQIGIVGLGRMGGGIARRLQRGGHDVVGFDTEADSRKRLEADGIATASSLEDCLARLRPPRRVWLMVPAGAAVDDAIAAMSPHLGPEAVLVDGGNSNYKDSVRRHQTLAGTGTGFLDVGTSGGIWGDANGYCLMIGGDAVQVQPLRPVFETLAPARDRGWRHVGPPGAGHLVKMVHNGIEYGMMQAYAEGFALLEGHEEYDLNLAEIARLWTSGSVVRSWLLELAGRALDNDPALEGLSPRVGDSGEGRWMVAEALDMNVAAPVITMSLVARLQSRDPASFANKLLSALRREFGGHEADR